MDQHTPRHELDQAPVRLARPLPRKAQVTVVAFGAALLFAAFFVGPAALHRLGLGAPPATDAAAPAGGDAFRLTDRQWAALRITPVADQVFQDAAETDGKIAIDDDLVTPVFSPYTGRVTRLMAHAGDVVARGAPLFAVQATELAQAQNDLITAVAGLKTAKAQLNLATTNERRQHDLYAAQGAALKDWQQAQVDLATAQGGTNSASIALAAVRSRLRILGKSDAQIDQIENAPDFLHLDADTVVTAPIAGTVEQRQIGLGQNIVSASSGASTPVFMIADLSKVWLIGNA
ncbi:MAG TPA: efflux RND transporter periplasmic adaptor subunit, partial [Rhodopila sp.]